MTIKALVVDDSAQRTEPTEARVAIRALLCEEGQ